MGQHPARTATDDRRVVSRALPQIVRHRCLRCGYEWTPNSRTAGGLPKACPKCHNLLWNLPRPSAGKLSAVRSGISKRYWAERKALERRMALVAGTQPKRDPEAPDPPDLGPAPTRCTAGPDGGTCAACRRAEEAV